MIKIVLDNGETATFHSDKTTEGVDYKDFKKAIGEARIMNSFVEIITEPKETKMYVNVDRIVYIMQEEEE